ncbi:uncharacterized protein PRCAT00005257001 [Priceomyces carsonii]|uniref:uncharacterized protein n=1 Tax=Priceomyces carsonii TaxID=28549 RepID=UPI002ED9E7D5|nr:unnamed protein product [Priceomyces carsonii]
MTETPSNNTMLRRPVIGATLDDVGIRISNQYLEELREEEDDRSRDGFLSGCYGGLAYRLTANFYKTHITYEDILWCTEVKAEAAATECEISYVIRGKTAELKKITVRISDFKGGNMAECILSRAYRDSIVSPRVLILINPHSGQGKALKIYESSILPILKAAHARVTYLETKYSKHGIEIGRDLDEDSYDIIACCSGDGTPHEVMNGFFQKGDQGEGAFDKIAITQLPCGSGNALSLSTFGTTDSSLATLLMLKAKRTKLDLMAVTQGTGNNEETKLSFLSQCYGMIADSDIGTEHLRWLGPLRFELGVVQRVLTRASYPCELYVNYVIDAKEDIKKHVNNYVEGTAEGPKPCLIKNYKPKLPSLDDSPPSNWIKVSDKIVSKLSQIYVGKMPYVLIDTQFFPAALPNDGLMDMILTDTNMPIIQTASILLSIDKGSHVEDPKVHHSKISGYRLVPKLNKGTHYISVDGESFAFAPLQVEVLPGVLTSLLPNGRYVDTSFTVK